MKDINAPVLISEDDKIEAFIERTRKKRLIKAMQEKVAKADDRGSRSVLIPIDVAKDILSRISTA